MRYYSISISGAPGEFQPVAGASQPGALWDTWINGGNDPGAQQIEFSIEMQEYAAPTSNSTIIIKGVSWDQIKVANKLIGSFITMHGGMKPGLPLATEQARVNTELFHGKILKAWGNWEGTEMSLGLSVGAGDPDSIKNKSAGGNGASQVAGLAEQAIGAIGGGGGGSAPAAARRYKGVGYRSIDRRPFARGPSVSPTDIGGDVSSGFDTSGSGGISPGFGGGASAFFGGGVPGLSQPLNLIHNMMPNMPLSGAIQQTLGKIFPGANINTRIHPGLKLPYQDAGMYQNMQQYAGFLKDLSHSILGAKNYDGIKMSSHGNTIDVTDGTQPAINQGIIQVVDIIGQPTWVDQFTIHLKVVLRADLHIRDSFTLPPNILIALGPDANPLGPNGSASPQRGHITVEGMTFTINRILHVGDFRSPHGSDWSTNYEAQVAGEGGITPPNTDTGRSIDNSSNNQNPNNAPPTENPPAAIPGFPSPVPQLSNLRTPLRVFPLLPVDRFPGTISFGSTFKRRLRNRHG